MQKTQIQFLGWKISGGGNDNLLKYVCLEEFYGQRSLVAMVHCILYCVYYIVYNIHIQKYNIYMPLVSQTVKNLPARQKLSSISRSRTSLEGNSSPIQSPCLRIPWTGEQPGGPQSMGMQKSDTAEQLTYSAYFQKTYFPSECYNLEVFWEGSRRITEVHRQIKTKGKDMPSSFSKCLLHARSIPRVPEV